MSNEVLLKFSDLVAKSIENHYDDNFDYDRFGVEPVQPPVPAPTSLASIGFKRYFRKQLARQYHFVKNILTTGSPTLSKRSQALNWIKPNLAELQWFYDHLSDDESKELLIYLLAYKALGYRHVKLPLNTPGYWHQKEVSKSFKHESNKIDLGYLGLFAAKFKLDPLGYPIEVFSLGVQNDFQLQQYRCVTSNYCIEVEKDDVVIDAGGCFGETALYFAHKAGPDGRIFSFEFLPANVDIFKKNLENNPSYSKNISLIQHPLWLNSDLSLYVEGEGPGTRVCEKTNNLSATQVKTISIDDMIAERSISKLDFIKMDIEGSELAALKGAEESIRKFKPKLAISIYHRAEDYWAISQWINRLNLGYQFHIRHFTIHAEETVLFAVVSH